MLARARTCTCGRVSDTSSYTCGREPWLRCAPTRAGAYFCRTFRGLPSVSQSYTPPSMEDGPTRTHTLHTIGSGADTRHAVTGRSTGSGLLDAQHTAHRTAHEVALYSGVLRDRHGRRRWSTGTGTQNSRTDIPPRAGGGGARERRGIWTRSLAGARPQIRRQSLQAASAIRAGSQKRSGAVLTASSQRTTEFTMMSEEKGCSCGTMR